MVSHDDLPSYRATVLTMTNFGAIEDYRRLVSELGELVPDAMAHIFAGCGRGAWNSLKRRKRISVIEFKGQYFVKLADIEKRDLRPGRRSPIREYFHRLDKFKV